MAREDDPDSRTDSHSGLEHYLESLLRSVTELAELGLVQSATAEVRTQPAPPLFKLYIINRREAFHGFYPVGEQAGRGDGDTHSVFDPAGMETPLFHQEASEDPEAVGSQYVKQATTWFDSLWTRMNTEVTL